MGGVAKSAGGFLGLSDGPKAPDGQFGNAGLDSLNGQNSLYGDSGQLGDLSKYSRGQMSSDSILADTGGDGLRGGAAEGQELANQLATGATTGSRYATEQVQNNGILGGLFGQDGQLNKAESRLDDLNNQGFELKPEDMTLYGQTSGNIARMFGQQGNQMAQDLASRGLASAPSGAAGAMFSGLAGNQNEMLAQAQQQIMQQRFANTQNQIAQQQNFINSLGAQGANAINQQYGRALAGAQNQRQGIEGAAGLQQGANNAQNQYGLQKSQFDVANTPMNFMDYGTAGLGQGIQAGSGGAVASMFSGGGGSAPAQPGQKAKPGQTQLPGPPAPGTDGALALTAL